MNNVLYIPAIPLIAFGFIVFVMLVEVPILRDNPPLLPENVPTEQWLSSFQFWAILCVVVVGLTSFIWCILGHKVFKTIHQKPSRNRVLWVILLVISVLIAIITFQGVEPTKNESGFVYLFFGLNALGPYYVATVLFSPPSVKYTPIGSMWIRRW